MCYFSKRGVVWVTLIGLILAGWVTAADTPAKADSSGRITILDAGSLWHCRFVKGNDMVRLESGELQNLNKVGSGQGGIPWTWVKKKKESGKIIYVRRFVKGSGMRRRPGPPPADWIEADFDDSSWGLYRGPFLGAGARKKRWLNLKISYRLVFLRGKFEVTDPAKVSDMSLSVSFEGGAAVYINGKEIKRAYLPDGELSYASLAEDYPMEAYMQDGKLIHAKIQKKYPEVFKKRIRSINDIKIPASLLRKGVNVLAIRLHFAPAPEVVFTGTIDRGGANNLLWPRVGLETLTLSAPADAAVVPGAPRAPMPKGFRVWNSTIVRRVHESSSGSPYDSLNPIRIVGARNGFFSGQVVVSSDKPVKGLSADAGDLKGTAGSLIKSSAIRVSYALPDGPFIRRGSSSRIFDTLSECAPAEVPVFQNISTRTSKPTGPGLSVRPVWVTIQVPADASPGEYKGTLTIQAQDIKPVTTGIRLKVIDWLMPDAKDFTTYMGLIQSPDSLAMKYNVEMWSEEHWKLVEKSLELTGKLGGKILYIPLLARTHFGNAHSMVRWIPEEDGSYSHDFSIVKKYVDLVAKHQGKLQVVCLYCWEPVEVWSNFDPTFYGDGKIRFSVMDPATGKLEVKQGPEWGTPESRTFWKPAIKGVRKILKKRDLADCMMIGLCADYSPSEKAVSDLEAAAPGAPWVVHSHGNTRPQGRYVGYRVVVWATGGVSDPELPGSYGHTYRRYYGWKYKNIMGYFGRNCIWQAGHLARYRVYPEVGIVGRGNLGDWDNSGKKFMGGTDGVGRIGVDFWPVVKDKRGRIRGTLAGYYASWGGLSLSTYGITSVVGPDKNGPVPTIRYEMLRECLQENEARIFLERILTDKSRRAELGEELALQAQEILDERTRALIDFDLTYQGDKDVRWYICSDWQERSEKLYAVAAEAAKALK